MKWALFFLSLLAIAGSIQASPWTYEGVALNRYGNLFASYGDTVWVAGYKEHSSGIVYDASTGAFYTTECSATGLPPAGWHTLVLKHNGQYFSLDTYYYDGSNTTHCGNVTFDPNAK